MSKSTSQPKSVPNTRSSPLRIGAFGSTNESLWEQAIAAVPAAEPTRVSSGVVHVVAGNKRQIAFVAALIAGIILCAAWSGYCLVSHAPATPTAPRQLAPVDGDPSV